MSDDEQAILVTGATGRVGGAVVRALAAEGIPSRALVRDPAKATDLPITDVVTGDLGRPDTVDEALDGVSSVFLVFPTLQAEEEAPRLIHAFAERVDHVVYLSAQGAESDDADRSAILASHARLERLIRGTSLRWTFLRPGGFATNTLGFAEQVRAGDEIRWYHGRARRALIHERDIAEVGVRALVDGGHDGMAHHLTGPDSLTQVEQVAAIGRALGRDLRFVELSPDEAKRELFAGAPPGVADAIVDAHARMVVNPEPVSTTVDNLLGRPALTYDSWARDHVADFR
jgi:uncharacterized protein YbjT (DUF2867 family)